MRQNRGKKEVNRKNKGQSKRSDQKFDDKKVED